MIYIYKFRYLKLVVIVGMEKKDPAQKKGASTQYNFFSYPDRLKKNLSVFLRMFTFQKYYNTEKRNKPQKT